MKTISAFIVLSAIALLGTPVAQAKAPLKPDFSSFKGTYSGTWTLLGSGVSLPAAVTVSVVAPKSNKTMTLTISGLLSFGGASLPIQTSITLTHSHMVSGTAALMGYIGPVPTLPSHFSGKGTSFTFPQIITPGATLFSAPISGSVSYTLTFKKKSLSISGVGSVLSGGTTSGLQILVNAKK